MLSENDIITPDPLDNDSESHHIQYELESTSPAYQ